MVGSHKMKILVASWSIILRISLTSAYPQIDGDDANTEYVNDMNGNNINNYDNNPNDIHSVGHATLLINNERKDITERTTLLDPPLDVGSAMIIDAPYGSGCFFSRSVTDEQSRLDNTFVSQIFYNTGREDLTVPFPAASSVTCFMVPHLPGAEAGAETGADETIVLWLESSSSMDLGLSPEEAPRYELKFLDLLQESGPQPLGIHDYDKPIMLVGAAVVHASGSEAGCLAMEFTYVAGQAPIGESNPVTQDGPLVEGPPWFTEPLLNEKPPPIEPIESDEGFRPAGRVQYFALGNPMLENMQIDSIHCFGNQNFASGQT